MRKFLPMAKYALALAVVAGAGLAYAAGPMTAPSTGSVVGDFDIDTESYRATPSEASTLGAKFFHVDWSPVVDKNGQPHLSGRVHDDYGEPAKNVQLQISALDTNGHEIGHVIRPVEGLVPAEGDAYFDVVVPAAQSYQVTVSSFDLIDIGE